MSARADGHIDIDPACYTNQALSRGLNVIPTKNRMSTLNTHVVFLSRIWTVAHVLAALAAIWESPSLAALSCQAK